MEELPNFWSYSQYDPECVLACKKMHVLRCESMDGDPSLRRDAVIRYLGVF